MHVTNNNLPENHRPSLREVWVEIVDRICLWAAWTFPALAAAFNQRATLVRAIDAQWALISRETEALGAARLGRLWDTVFQRIKCADEEMNPDRCGEIRDAMFETLARCAPSSAMWNTARMLGEHCYERKYLGLWRVHNERVQQRAQDVRDQLETLNLEEQKDAYGSAVVELYELEEQVKWLEGHRPRDLKPPKSLDVGEGHRQRLWDNIQDALQKNEWGHPYIFEAMRSSIFTREEWNDLLQGCDLAPLNHDDVPPSLGNIGNSCYLNSILQVLLSNPNYCALAQKRDLERPFSPLLQQLRKFSYDAGAKIGDPFDQAFAMMSTALGDQRPTVTLEKINSLLFDGPWQVFPQDQQGHQMDAGELWTHLSGLWHGINGCWEETNVRQVHLDWSADGLSESAVEILERAANRRVPPYPPQRVPQLLVEIDHNASSTLQTLLDDTCYVSEASDSTLDLEITHEEFEQLGAMQGRIIHEHGRYNSPGSYETHQMVPVSTDLAVTYGRFPRLRKNARKIPWEQENGVFSRACRLLNREGRDVVYNVDSFVVHRGESPHSGHYLAYVSRGGRYWRCNDDTILEIDEQQFCTAGQDAYLLVLKQQPSEIVLEENGENL